MHWIAASGIVDTPSLVALTPTTLHIVDETPAKIWELEKVLEDGTPADIALQKKGKAVPLEKITVISSDEKEKSATVKWRSFSLTSSYGSEDESIEFSTAAERDEFMLAMKDTFGDKANFSRVEFSRLRAMITPICSCLFAAGVGWLIIYTAEHLDGREGRSHNYKARIFVYLVEKLVSLLGVSGVKIAVFVVVLLVIYIFGRELGDRLKNPPIMLTLKPESGWKPAKK